jgi:hypothetical protein
MRLDLLDILFVQARKFASRFTMRAQQLIDLGMNGLGVPVLGSSDEQRHHPRCQGGNRSPSECLWREGKPCDRVEHYNGKGARMGRELSNARSNSTRIMRNMVDKANRSNQFRVTPPPV